MPRQVQMVRGATSSMGAYVGLQGQIVVDTTLWTIRVLDGVTPGGFVLLSGANNFSDVPNKPVAKSNLGLGTAADFDVGDFDPAGAATAALATALSTTLQIAQNLNDVANKVISRANLGVAIGVDVQAFHANLTAFSGLVGAADRLPYFTGVGALALSTYTAFARTLLDDVDAATMQATLNVPTRTGGNASGSWGINVTGSSASCTGNAATATAAGSATTAGTANALNTGNNYQVVNLTCTGALQVNGEITGLASDDRLKVRRGCPINALDKIETLDVFFYKFNDKALSLGLPEGNHLGLSAQQVEKILPEAIRSAPCSDEFITYQDREIIPFLVQCIKELMAEIRELKAR